MPLLRAVFGDQGFEAGGRVLTALVAQGRVFFVQGAVFLFQHNRDGLEWGRRHAREQGSTGKVYHEQKIGRK
jgi:hypothetical protein